MIQVNNIILYIICLLMNNYKYTIYLIISIICFIHIIRKKVFNINIVITNFTKQILNKNLINTFKHILDVNVKWIENTVTILRKYIFLLLYVLTHITNMLFAKKCEKQISKLISDIIDFPASLAININFTVFCTHYQG